MLPVEKKQRLVILFLLIGAVALGTGPSASSLHANESPAEEDSVDDLHDTAIASDLTAEEMAREILILQEQLGGSIVPSPPNPPHWRYQGDVVGKALITDKGHERRPLTSRTTTRHLPTHQTKKIELLREAAFDLDSTAHQLERVDLYEQADALRNVASRLRRDARELKQQLTSPSHGSSSYPMPTQPSASPISE